jgi:hypothetical protein
VPPENRSISVNAYRRRNVVLVVPMIVRLAVAVHASGVAHGVLCDQLFLPQVAAPVAARKAMSLERLTADGAAIDPRDAARRYDFRTSHSLARGPRHSDNTASRSAELLVRRSPKAHRCVSVFPIRVLMEESDSCVMSAILNNRECLAGIS